MKTIFCILFLSTWTILAFGQTSSQGKKAKADAQQLQSTSIHAMDATYPFCLDKVNFNDRKKFIALNDGIVSRIQKIVDAYYIRECEGDSLLLSSAIAKVYINTLRFHDSLHTIYLILLKHEPTGYLNGKVLFYDNKAKTFSEKVFDFNLHSLYDSKDDQLMSSNLKSQLKINGPEIDQIDFDHDGVMDYRFTRLIHNGTYNAIQTTVLTFHHMNVDTLSLLEVKL